MSRTLVMVCNWEDDWEQLWMKREIRKNESLCSGFRGFRGGNPPPKFIPPQNGLSTLILSELDTHPPKSDSKK